MKNRLKDNLLFYITLTILIIWGICVVVGQYNYQQSEIQANENYLSECDENCYGIVTKPIDTVTQFFNNIGNTSLHLLSFFSPLFVIVPAVYLFNRKFRQRDLKNVLTRTTYKKEMTKTYLSSLKSTLIFPLFLIILFIFSYFQSGNFNIDYTFSHGGDSYVDEINIRNWTIFVPVYIFTIWLHSIFWANLGIINVKKNKSPASAILSAYILYFAIFVILEVFIGEFIFSSSPISLYLGLGNIWLFGGVTYLGMIIMAIILVILSMIFVFFQYRNKESAIKECEK